MARKHMWVAAGLAGLLTAGTGARAGSIFFPDLTDINTGTASAFPDRTPANEAPQFAFDDTRQKGLIFNDVNNDAATPYEDVTAANPVIWTFDFPSAVTVRSYSLTSGNDAQGRDPRDFFLEGSNDGAAWTAVDTVAGHMFEDQPELGDNTGVAATQPPNRFETFFFNVDAPALFDQYRLRVIETRDPVNDRPQIADIQMFDTIVPEPGSLGVLGMAAVAMLRRRARR